MALLAEVRAHAAGRTTTGTQDYTGFGGQPKALIVISVNATATPTLAGQNAPSSIGFAADNAGSLEQFVIAGFSDEMTGNPAPESGGTRATAANSGKQSLGGSVLQMLQSGNPATLATAAVSAMIADGWTGNWTDAPDLTTRRFISLALGGADITAVSARQQSTTRTTVGTENYTVLPAGKTASVVFFMSASPLTHGATAIDDTVCFGWACRTPTNVLKQAAISWFDDDAAANMQPTVDGALTTSCMILLTSAGAVDALAAIQSFNSDGTITLNYTDAPASAGMIFYTLAIEGGAWDSLQFTAQGTAGAQTFSGYEFTPQAALFASTGRTTTAFSSATVDDAFTIGMASSSAEQGMISNMQQDANASSFASRSHSETDVLHKISGTAKTTAWQGNVTSFPANGIAMNWTAGQPNIFSALVMGDTPPVPPAITSRNILTYSPAVERSHW